MVKFALLVSVAVPPRTRTRPWVVADEGAVQAWDPSFAVELVIAVQLVPPSME